MPRSNYYISERASVCPVKAADVLLIIYKYNAPSPLILSLIHISPTLLHEKAGDAFAPRNKYALEIDDEIDPPMFKTVSYTHLEGLLICLSLGHLEVPEHPFHDLLADGHGGVKAGHGLSLIHI